MRRRSWYLIAAILCGLMLFGKTTSMAQEPRFQVMINADKLHPGDTLDLLATYEVEGRQLPALTFAMTIMGPQDRLWQLRWPMTDGKCAASVILPDSLPTGAYNLLFAVQPQYLKLFGELIYPPPPCDLTVAFGIGGMLAKDQHRTMKVPQGGRFEIDQIYWEDSLLLSFVHAAKVQGPPMVKLDNWLDAGFEPAAVRVKQIVLNAKESEDFVPLRLSRDSIMATGQAFFHPQFRIKQKEAQLTGLTGLALYDSLYLPNPFKLPAKHLYNGLSDSAQVVPPTAFEWLQTFMKNAAVDIWGNAHPIPWNASALVRKLENETMIEYNKKWYRIYYNGSYGDLTPLTLPPDAFASIKVFEPPFVQIPGTDIILGTIAFFEKRYPFNNPFRYNHLFKLKGYTPALYKLPLY